MAGRPPKEYLGTTKLRYHCNGYKLYQIAAAVGIPQTTLSLYLVGHRPLADNLNLLYKFSKLLGVPEEDLVGFIPEETLRVERELTDA